MGQTETSADVKYQFTPDMREISGFGGEYEAACRRMLDAALRWFDDHPDADPVFASYSSGRAVVKNDNADAEALSKAACDAAGEFGPSGAMRNAVVGTALWVKGHDWDAYVRKMTHPEGETGILRDNLKEKTEDYERLSARFDELQAECDKRGAVIAEKVLGWQKHKVNSGQEAYAPDAETARNGIGLGRSLTDLIDREIARMSTSG